MVATCFNTPKGHLHLQTRTMKRFIALFVVSIPRRVTYTCRQKEGDYVSSLNSGFNTPKGHLHLQTWDAATQTITLSSFNTPKGHLHLQTTKRERSSTSTIFVSIPRRVTYTCRHCQWSFSTPGFSFQYPEGSPTPADIQKGTSYRGGLVCFNTPKGHLHLQTQKEGSVVIDVYGFNTPKGHLHLQTLVPDRHKSILAPCRIEVKCPGQSTG